MNKLVGAFDGWLGPPRTRFESSMVAYQLAMVYQPRCMHFWAQQRLPALEMNI